MRTELPASVRAPAYTSSTVLTRKPPLPLPLPLTSQALCGLCNSSKGNRPWAEWLLNDMPYLPHVRRAQAAAAAAQARQQPEPFSRG
jgi:hypothetical protein